MKNKLRLGMGLFFLLGLSTLVFGAFVFYMTYELANLEGRTVLIGNVLDTNDQPLEGVQIVCEDRETMTDINGQYELKGVPEGLVTMEFYKPGYVVYELKWLAYPLNDFDDIKKSPNNISYSFIEGGSSDLQLKKELEQVPIDKYDNGTLEIGFVKEGSEVLNITELFVSNGQDNVSMVSTDQTEPLIDITGDGNFKVGLSMDGPFITGFHPVGHQIDITQELVELTSSIDEIEWSGGSSSILLRISNLDPTGKIKARLIDNLTGSDIDIKMDSDPSSIAFEIPPGVYDIEITGKGIRDYILRPIIVNQSQEKELETTLKEGDIDEDLDLSIKANYTIAFAYLGIALVMFFGGYYMKNGGSWAVLLILAFVGFLSRGLIDLYIININQLMAIALMVVLFSIRSEYNRKRQRSMDRRYRRSA